MRVGVCSLASVSYENRRALPSRFPDETGVTLGVARWLSVAFGSTGAFAERER